MGSNAHVDKNSQDAGSPGRPARPDRARDELVRPPSPCLPGNKTQHLADEGSDAADKRRCRPRKGGGDEVQRHAQSYESRDEKHTAEKVEMLKPLHPCSCLSAARPSW